MTCSAKIIRELGMQQDHQNWYYSLLTVLDQYEQQNPTPDESPNARFEVLRRLEALGISPWVHQQFAWLLGARGTERV